MRNGRRMSGESTLRWVTNLVVCLVLVACAGPLTTTDISARLTAHRAGPPDPMTLTRWKGIVGHTHNMRTKEMPFEDAKKQLVAWARTMGIAAIGVGSPWEPESAKASGRYEGPDRDLYYAGKVEPQSVMHREQIAQLFTDLNRLSGGNTFFYQDNETPKSRMGHVWWFGFHYEVPAWHDYSQDRPVQYWQGDPAHEINAITGKPERRRSLLEITAIQRKAGAVSVFAHPTSWWLNDDKQFITNIAAQTSLFLHADGRLDGLVVMGYQARRTWYQKLWFHLLDTGAIVPGFAEVDYALDSKATYETERTFINYMDIPGIIDVLAIVDAARRGASFASTGAFLTIAVDGTPMGQIARTTAGQTHRLHIEAYPGPGQDHFSRIEIIGRGGAVLARLDGFRGGVLEYELTGQAQPHYVVVRAFGQHDDPDAEFDRDITHMAISNPVYLHPAGFSFAPQQTAFSIEVTDGTPWLGGTLELQHADGTVIETHAVQPGVIRARLPASARVQLKKDGREPTHFYLAMENPKVQQLLNYLVLGEFLDDHPGLVAGEVPPEAYYIAEMRQALRESHYVLE